MAQMTTEAFSKLGCFLLTLPSAKTRVSCSRWLSEASECKLSTSASCPLSFTKARKPPAQRYTRAATENIRPTSKRPCWLSIPSEPRPCPRPYWNMALKPTPENRKPNISQTARRLKTRPADWWPTVLESTARHRHGTPVPKVRVKRPSSESLGSGAKEKRVWPATRKNADMRARIKSRSLLARLESITLLATGAGEQEDNIAVLEQIEDGDNGIADTRPSGWRLEGLGGEPPDSSREGCSGIRNSPNPARSLSVGV
ncbi:hypothetical protein VSDG_05397 [Cytospora chrysosperma]|uniref:Uncharacterized protein n=1 Tax=Cytospora chrysosperma TaxID=252740 RepID=A0A423VZN9_CYTCH|nr:hypothetical protein VSDG_05397 [Valsa sordida]